MDDLDQLKMLAALVFAFCSSAVCAWRAYRKTALMADASGWRKAEGRIVESRLITIPGRKDQHFRITYVFNPGQPMLGETPRLAGDWFYNLRQQAAFVARYQPGQAVDVYYNPADARQNCLDRTDASGVSILWILAISAATLGSILLWLYRNR